MCSPRIPSQSGETAAGDSKANGSDNQSDASNGPSDKNKQQDAPNAAPGKDNFEAGNVSSEKLLRLARAKSDPPKASAATANPLPSSLDWQQALYTLLNPHAPLLLQMSKTYHAYTRERQAVLTINKEVTLKKTVDTLCRQLVAIIAALPATSTAERDHIQRHLHASALASLSCRSNNSATPREIRERQALDNLYAAVMVKDCVMTIERQNQLFNQLQIAVADTVKCGVEELLADSLNLSKLPQLLGLQPPMEPVDVEMSLAPSPVLGASKGSSEAKK